MVNCEPAAESDPMLTLLARWAQRSMMIEIENVVADSIVELCQ
jgi:hypothetical protein